MSREWRSSPPAIGDYAVDNVEYLRSRWVTIGTHEYKVIPARRGIPETPCWMSAVTAAQWAVDEGGYLASVTTATENTALFVAHLVNNPLMWDFTLPSSQPNNQFGPWIGGVRVSESAFAWSNGETWSYQNFRAGEPNNSGNGEDFVHYSNTANRNSQWNDFLSTALTAGCVIERTPSACLAVTRPTSVRVARGGTANFSVSATGGGPFTYRWRHERTPGVFVNLSDGTTPSGSAIAGSTTKSLTVSNVGGADAGEYDCVVSNTCESFASAGSATLITPVFIRESRRMRISKTVVLSDVAIGERTDLIPGTNSASFTIEDSTGALSVFGPAAAINSTLNLTPLPNNVFSTLEGTTTSFKGLREITTPFVGASASRRRDVDRLPVIEQAFEDGSLRGEALEARLVELPNVQIVEDIGSPFTVRVYTTRGGGKVWMRLTAVANAANARFGRVPSFPVRIRGVFWQQVNDPAIASLDTGYYVLAMDVLPGCVADFDDGTGVGRPDGGVTIDDLLYYLGLFAAGNVAADVDDGSGTGTTDGGVTIDDLLFYLVRFDAGC